MKPKHPSRLRFRSFDGGDEVSLANGKDCVAVLIEGRSHAGAVMTADEAEHLGWNIIRQARYSRQP